MRDKMRRAQSTEWLRVIATTRFHYADPDPAPLSNSAQFRRIDEPQPAMRIAVMSCPRDHAGGTVLRCCFERTKCAYSRIETKVSCAR
jgi:hypothetical protein